MGEMEKKPEMGKMTTGMEEHRKLQEALKAKGNDPGPIDGRMGPKTRAALKAFQEANGLKATGQLDSQTADKLGLEKGAMPMGKEMKAMKKEGTEPMSKEPMSKEKK
jgi:peptidoglycan hydrolase-like protein with peptidoglycan-binding domain